MLVQRERRVLRAAVPPVVLALLLFGCGGSADEGLPPATVDLSGDWVFVITRGQNTCGDPTGEAEESRGTIAQAGSQVTVQMPFGVFEGTVSAAQAVVSGTYAEDGGYTTFVAWTLSEAAGGVTGTVQWTWSRSATGSPAECDGMSHVVGTRVPPPSGTQPPLPPAPVADFLLADVNPNSSTFGTDVSPRDHLGRVSAWYFGAAT